MGLNYLTACNNYDKRTGKNSILQKIYRNDFKLWVVNKKWMLLLP